MILLIFFIIVVLLVGNDPVNNRLNKLILHKKLSFSLRIFSANGT